MPIPNDAVVAGLLLLLLGVPGALVALVTIRLMRRSGVEPAAEPVRIAPRYLSPEWEAEWFRGWQRLADQRQSGQVGQPDIAGLACAIGQTRLLNALDGGTRVSSYRVATETVQELQRQNPSVSAEVVAAVWLSEVQGSAPMNPAVYRDLGFSDYTLDIVSILEPPGSEYRRAGSAALSAATSGQADLIRAIRQPAFGREAARVAAILRDRPRHWSD